MGYGSGFGGRPRSGGFRSGGGFRRSFGPREMHKIKCTECGNDAEVPFKPREGIPVYCRDCFFKKKGITPRSQNKESGEGEAKESSEFGEDDSGNEEGY